MERWGPQAHTCVKWCQRPNRANRTAVDFTPQHLLGAAATPGVLRSSNVHLAVLAPTNACSSVSFSEVGGATPSSIKVVLKPACRCRSLQLQVCPSLQQHRKSDNLG